MRDVVAANAALLNGAGFKKRRHAFNRTTRDGLVHVVHFWMAPKEPPAWTEVPGLRERLYGKFRLDFGVYVPEMRRMGAPVSDWINEYNCQLRWTIGQLLGDDRTDLWWSLDDQRAPDVADAALREWGLPCLALFPDKEAVLARFYESGPLGIGMPPAGDLDIADMLTTLGRTEEARSVLERYVERPMVRGHAAYLAEYLPTIGQGDLVPTSWAEAPAGE